MGLHPRLVAAPEWTKIPMATESRASMVAYYSVLIPDARLALMRARVEEQKLQVVLGGSSKSTEKKPATRTKLTDEQKAEKAQSALVNRMGVDPEHGWKAKYEVLPGKEHVVAELKKLAKDADEIYLATDLDREGEAIAWHLREVIGGDDSRYHRVVFNEITKNAIQEAFKQPTRLDLNRVNAQQARRFLDRVVGFMYLPAKANRYGNKANAQEAHEAIRPSNVALKGDSLAGVERDAQQYLSSTILVDANGVELKAKGRTLVFDGFTKVRGQNKSDDDVLLPAVKVGEILKLEKLDPSQHFTKPPARFTEASLVKELEKRGIGRPSTYAAIISTIQDRGYVKLDNRRLFAEKMDLEGQLDKVADGERNWKELLDSFYGDFKKRLTTAQGENGMRRNQPVEVEAVHCKECERPMQIRTGTTGVFLGCSGYNLPPKERCKGTLNLTPVESLAILSDDDSAETADLMSKKRCPVCGTAMDSYVIDGGRKLHICGNNPDCDGYELEEGEFKIKGYDGPTIPCDKCDGEMHQRHLVSTQSKWNIYVQSNMMITLFYVMEQRVYSWRQANSLKYAKHVHRRLRSYVQLQINLILSISLSCKHLIKIQMVIQHWLSLAVKTKRNILVQKPQKHQGEDGSPSVTLYLNYYDPKLQKVLKHSTALERGRIGSVNLFASRKQSSRQPLYPTGYANPEQQPRYPQQRAEIMGGYIALSENKSKTPEDLEDTMISRLTAQEMGWVK
ncbi:unnamed protein product [Oppiella nova]|uniref:DNA topoisomerase n=1 Tax=Oppiella nova TaxID=334625 RepID=A0A7R9Q8E1_9ACAR|nr:unnamed protein product [Oppiella nova]CAG2155675.1 unnamed protein product [Oppiella nova]